jgi:hypothetical protein
MFYFVIFSNLLDDSVGSLRVFDEPLKRPTFVNGRVSAGLATRAMYSGFFRQSICSINIIEYLSYKTMASFSITS